MDNCYRTMLCGTSNDAKIMIDVALKLMNSREVKRRPRSNRLPKKAHSPTSNVTYLSCSGSYGIVDTYTKDCMQKTPTLVASCNSRCWY